jgi:hypothetical protein
MMSYASFFEVQSGYKNICTPNLEMAVIFWLIYFIIHFICIEIEIKIQTYVVWKLVINF